MKHPPVKVEICVLKKRLLIRAFLVFPIISFVILEYIEAYTLMLFFIPLPTAIWLILVQVMEKIEVIGSLLFDDEKIIFKEGEVEYTMSYNQIKNIKIKGKNIKGDAIGYFYFKKGHKNWVTINDIDNVEHRYQILLSNELQYRVLKRKIDEISNGLENKTQPRPPNPPQR
jgi:hypothetical protein